MDTVIAEIVAEWSRRIPSGIIDLKNEQHIVILYEFMHEYLGDKDVINEWVGNLINRRI